jgi:hypothetical protein
VSEQYIPDGEDQEGYVEWLDKKAEIARLREERRSISTLHQKVESLEAENKKLREERRWIPVGERLPEIDVPVLVWQQGRDYTAIGWREHRPYYIVPETIWTLGDELDKGYPPEKITHWQPLPPGPETKEVGDVPIQK